MIYFWADTHFNHEGIIKHCNRPFQSLEEMNREIISRWNERIKKQDDMYFLGDFGLSAFGKTSLWDIFEKLRGRKHLVVGNHDEQNKVVMRMGWATISWLKKVRWEGHRVILCHYPLETWTGVLRGYFHLHGHSHGTLKHRLSRRIDVGFDCFPSGPVSIEEAASLVALSNFEPTDHHGDI